MARRAEELPGDPAVVVVNPDEDCSPEALRAVVEALLTGPEPELESLDAAEALRELRADGADPARLRRPHDPPPREPVGERGHGERRADRRSPSQVTRSAERGGDRELHAAWHRPTAVTGYLRQRHPA
jgi:hypothetical protein